MLRRALELTEKAHGAEAFAVLESLLNLGGLYRDRGQFVQAEPLLKRPVVVSEKSFL